MSGLRVPVRSRRQETAADGGQAGPPARRSRTGVIGWLRWGWRQLTSMRTALVLLFLLAVASVPGSVLPQRSIDPAAVTSYYTAHPALAPVLARLSLFSVFGAPWFAAIYILLFVSLAGCVLPRTFRLAGSARQQPPPAPRNLARLPLSAGYQTSMAPEAAAQSAAAMLAARRFRLRTGDGWVSAEKGYLREVGNLLFHVALLALLGSVALGGLFGYKANRLLIVGQQYANTPTALDVFRPGRLVTAGDLQPFSIALKSFNARYITSGPQAGQPISFSAALRYNSGPGQPMHDYDLRVNHPLRVDNTRVYLINRGYAPTFRITDGSGHVLTTTVPFIPVEQHGLTSEGVIKDPDAAPEQLGFAGVFLPTAVDAGGRLSSAFPAALNPVVSLVAYTGNLQMNSGQPQSVYQLDTGNLRRLPIAPQPLSPGQTMKLPDGAGSLTFVGYKPWISLAVTYDPGQTPALISGVAALVGLILSFMTRRRRVFVRAAAGPEGTTLVDVGGLTRSDAAGGFEAEFADLTALLRREQQGTERAAPDPAASEDEDDDGEPPAGVATDSAAAQQPEQDQATAEDGRSLASPEGE
jgi:cytochrome c biogenesis protein